MAIVTPFSDREALERFKESEPELRTVAQIARMTKEEFVQKYASGSFFNGDVRQARRVYETAVAINASNALIWANIKDTVASPFYRTTLFNNIPQEFIKNLENIPGYQRLFGSLDYIEVDHDRSVFSAAAYFVDLLRFIDDFVRDSRNQRDHAFLLENDRGKRRRPDLYNFRLDPQNTNELIPYIDLVNEVLEAIVRTEDEPDVYKILNAVDFPLSLPFNRSLAEVREYLKQLGTSLYAIYKAYKRLQIDNAAELARHIDREFLELSPGEYALISDETADPHAIERLYGTAYELTESSWANVPLSAEAKDRLGVATGRPIPERDDFQGMLARVADRLGPTEKAIADEIINYTAVLTDLSYNRYDLTRLSSLTVFLEQTGLDRKQINELLYQNLDGSEVNAGLSRLFFINNVQDGLRPLMLQDGPNGAGGFDEQLVNLSYAKLDRIYRFLKLARKLGWTFTDLDLALRSLHKPYVAGKMLEFDGIDDYVACRNVTNLDLTSLTIEAWVTPASQANNVIICKGKESDWRIHFLFLIDPDGKLAFYDNGKQQFVTGQSVVPTGTFSHVAVTVDNQGNVKFYINGNLDGDPANPITLSQPIQPVGTDIDIGRNLNDAYFSGIITELRLWSGVRSQVAIAGSRYKRFTGREVGLVGYWSLSENCWNKLFDQTPNRNDGVIGGAGFVTQPTWVQRDLVLDAAPEPVVRTGYQFNGIDQYMSARRVTGFDMAALTVEAWVKWGKPAAAEYEIVAKGDENTGQAQFRLWIDSNDQLAFAGAGWGEYASTRSLKPGVLTHVAVALPESALSGSQFWVTAELLEKLHTDNDSQKPYLFAFSTLDQFDETQKDTARVKIHDNVMNLQGTLGTSDFLNGLNTAIGTALLLTASVKGALPPQDIINNVFGLTHNTASTGSVEVTQDVLNQIAGHVPTSIYSQLENLMGQSFASYNDFLAALSKGIGAQEVAPFQAQILALSEKYFIRIYMDGIPEEFELTVNAPHGVGDTLTVGRKLKPGYAYYQGLLKELRIWNSVRMQDQILLHMVRTVEAREPGLIGYWRLNAIEDGQASDLSYNGNHLFLGGIQEDYMPEHVPAHWLLPDLPIATRGTALRFDGQNDRVIIQNAENRGPGAYDQLTLAFWFNATDVSADREQIIFTQGDAEDGLTIYIYQNSLSVVAWTDNLEGTAFQKAVFKTNAISSGTWHHIAVTKDETVSLDFVRYMVYLDGQLFGQSDEQFRLCPVEPTFLGSPAKDAVIWTEKLGKHSDSTAAQTGITYPHYFDGLLTDFRVWQAVKTSQELAIIRFIAPVEADTDLVVYLPLTEGSSAALLDESVGSKNTATFQDSERTLTVNQDYPDLEEIHAHYADPAALQWNNYIFSGRLYVGEVDSAIGVTFFSRYPDHKDRYYVLKRDKNHPAFYLSAHPQVIETLKGTTDSTLDPQENIWYHFRIEVEAAADRTTIKAKIWSQTSNVPTNFQIDAYDDSDVRITSGTVGLWTTGEGHRAFDDLTVQSPAVGTSLSKVLLSEDFENVDDGQAPDNWQQTGSIIYKKDTEHLFETYFGHERGTERLFDTYIIRDTLAYGSDVEVDNIHSHLQIPEVLSWTDYEFSGRMSINEDEGGIGVTFFSRYPEGKEQYYRLSRSESAPSFALTVQPDGLQTLTGNTDSGVIPVEHTWYHFEILAEATATETRIRAKVWRSGWEKPQDYQIDAFDSSVARLRAGTIGVWTAGSGLKLVTSLQVRSRSSRVDLYRESFSSYGEHQYPVGWKDSGGRDNFVQIPTLFTITEVQDSFPDWQDVNTYPLLLKPLNRKALRFDGVLRYAAEEKVIGLDKPPLTLEAWIMPAQNQTQRTGGPVLRLFGMQTGQSTFQLAVNAEARVVMTAITTSGTWVTLTGTTSLPIDKFTHVAVSIDDGATVRLYVNGQEDGTLNSLEAINLSGIGLEIGRGLDVSAATSRVDYFAGQLRDLRLWNVARTREQIDANRYEQPEVSDDLVGYWPFDEDSGVTAADRSIGGHNLLRLGGIETARHPVMNDPSVVFVFPEIRNSTPEPERVNLAKDLGLFDPAALKLDGNSNFVEIPVGQVPELDEATFEAWVKPDKLVGEATLWDQADNAVKLSWLDNQLKLSVAGSDPQEQTFDFGFDVNEWVHIAVIYSRTNQNAQLYINEHLVAEDKVTYKVANGLAISAALVGQNGNNLGNLRGLVKELRWWSVARTPEQIQTYLFRRLAGDEENLLVYRPFNEEASLEHAPTWVSPDLLDSSLGQGFWNSKRLAAVFDGKDGLVYWSDSTGGQTSVCQRRTVEVWFKADNKDIASRKQVIYSEGDDKHGLSIYLFDGQLYFGGYSFLDDTQDWGHWAGTWLSTNRLQSGKWHHAALVLDGRDEVRASSLQAFLDGKFVAEGKGAQLSQCSSNLALGGISGRILFHDGLPGSVAPQPASASFQGQILDLRVWNTARSPHQLQLYRYRQLTGQEPGLECWWQFEQVEKGQIPDLAGQGHVGLLLPSVQIQPINTVPTTPTAEDVLTGLAKIKRLIDKYQLPMDQLTSLWYEIRHTGKANGATLFDNIFNPRGSVFPVWSFHMDAPIRWDITGATDQLLSRQIRSRLMGALRVSYDNLNTLVKFLSGADETIIELDSDYLTNLYRLVRLPGLLGLNVTEFASLLKLMGLDKADSLDRFALVSDRVDWMQQLGINVFQLEFLSADQQSARVTFPYNDSSIRDLADSLRRQSSEFLAQETSFVTSEVGPLQSQGLFKLLGSLGDIDQIGAVEPAYAPPLHFDKLFFLGVANATPDATELRLNLAEVAFATLTQNQIDILKTNRIIDDNGLVLDEQGQGILLDPDPVKANFTDTRLKPLFANADATMLSTIREALERGLKIQTDFANKLIGMRDALAAAALAGLSSLVGAPPDRTLAVAQHLATDKTLKQFFVIMYGLQPDAEHKDLLPIPDTLTAKPTGYLYKLSKILYLAGQFNLTLDETVALVESPQYFTLKSILQPDISDLTSLYLFTTLKSAFSDTTGKLINVLGTDGKGSATVTAIQDLTGWEARQIEALMAYFGNELAYNRVAGLDRLRVIFEIAATMHVDVEFVTQLADTGELSIDFYAQQSASLLEVLRSQYDDKQWPQVSRPIHDRLAVQMRDALLARAMLNISPDFAGRRSPDALSEYLLLDVQTGSEVDTSRIVQATASLQLYVQRCMLNLEQGIDPPSVPTDQWEWMKNYRVWEANRKVFLYPENYIEPELRDNKTPFFQELEQDLIQGEIDQNLVEQAYTNYLNKFAEVANLKIVGSHYHAADVANVNDGLKGKNVLYLLGRTRTQPYVYYIRQCIEDEQWMPWQKINITFNADSATPVYAFNRLFIFWVEFTKKTEARDTGETMQVGNNTLPKQENVDVFKATVKYTYQNLAQEWVQPQVFIDSGRNLEKNEVVLEEWQHVYLQRSLEFFPSGAPPETAIIDANVTVLQIGANPPINGETKLTLSVPSMAMDKLTWSFWANFINNSTQGFASIQPPRGQSLRLVYYNNLRIPGLAESDNDFVIDVISNISPAPGAPDVQAMRAERDRARADLAALMVDDPTTLRQLQNAQGKLDTAESNYHDGLIAEPEPSNLDALKSTRDSARNELALLAAQLQVQDSELTMAQNNRDSARDAYQKALASDPTASNLSTLKQAWDDAEGELQKLQKKRAAQDHLRQAEQAYQNAVDAAKWQTADLTLKVHIGSGAPVTETKLLYGTWQYIAVTMDYDSAAAAYAVQLFVDGTPQGLQVLYKSNIFTPGRDLTIGYQVRDPQGKVEPGKDIPEQYTVQLSEFQLWKQVRPATSIESERFKRYATNLLVQGVFAIPLNRRESSAVLNLQPSNPGLSLQRGATPKPPIERERILLLWGKDVRRSILNTLATDKSINLVLEDPNTIPAITVASQFDVVANILYTQALTLVSPLVVYPPAYANLFPPLLSIPSSLGSMLGISNTTPVDLDALGKLFSVASIDERWATAYDSFSQQWLALTSPGPSLRELRNTVIALLNLILLLILAGNTDPLSYGLNLSLNQLYVQKTNKLSIHAYAADLFGVLTPPLNRFTPEIRRFIVAAANRAYSLTEPETQQFRAEIAGLSAFGVADIQANQPDRLKAFLKSSFGVDSVSIPQPLPAPSPEVLLANVLSYEATFMEINNQPGWYILDTGDEQFLIKTIGKQPLKSAKDRIEFIYGASTNDGSPQPLTMRFTVDDALVANSNPLTDFRFAFERLSTYVIHDLSLRLFAGGIDNLLSLDSQKLPEIDFRKQYQAGMLVTPPNFDRATNTIKTGIDFDGPNGLYYRELFFHIPFLIANKLNANQKFAEAQKWYHYIFDPTTSEPTGISANPNDRYWRFRPFRDLSLETLQQILSNKDALAEYREHPFDPHAIARLRLNAYQKAIVMKYINNLLDWGDNLFAQDTREAIGEAAQLYILAYNLLGQRPQSKVVKDFREVGTYDNIIAANKDGLPDFLAEIDRRISVPAGDGNIVLTPGTHIITDFGVPENDVFIGYWDRVEDRLFKIRHSLNLEGVFRQLALFQPPINPMALVSAIAGGRDLGSVLSDLNVAVPNYRFLFLLDKAKEMASTVNDLGAALLDALEKRDAEGLALLQNSQEKQILDMTTINKQNELDSARKGVEALNQSNTTLVAKKNYYDGLLAAGLNPAENAFFVMKNTGTGLKAVEGVARVISEGLKALPTEITGLEGVGGSPTAEVKIGSKEVRSPIDTAAAALGAVGEGLDLAADISEKRAEFDRRQAEWQFESANAQNEINEIAIQIAIAELQSSIAEQELAIHLKTIEQNQEIADFYRSKFTSKDLYNWMVNQLSGLYFQAYKLAYDYAKSTEKALQLERLTSKTFISFGHWDSLKKGLLSGSSLLLELSRMEKFYLDQSKRSYEIEKNISMQKSMPDALKSLISSGTADFQLTEKLFDQDYFGHYGRTIKTIAISVNTSTPIDPYDSVHATLTQLGSKTILAPDVNAVRYLLGAAGANQPDSSVLRVNWRANQQIAISNVSGDNGTFAIDFFFDDRYFPFEGTGAISSWRLEMPKETNRFDFNSITDVIIDVKYTALSDSGAFKQAVAKEMSNLKNG